MRRTALAITALMMLAVAVCGGPLQRSARSGGVLARPATIAQLRALRLKSQPIKVASGKLDPKKLTRFGQLPAYGPLPPSPPASVSGLYKDGEGIVMKPSSMVDPKSQSELQLCGVCLNQAVTDILAGKSSAPVVLTSAAGERLSLPLLSATFRSLPAGMHLYMLTLGLKMNEDRARYLLVAVGSTLLGDEAYTYSDGVFHVMIHYDAGTGGPLQVLAGVIMPQETAIAVADFSYAQLAVLD